MEHYVGINLALESFKDWSNYLLVTTVAAIGWVVAKEGVRIAPGARIASILLLCVSAILAVLTLSLVPLVAESLTKDTRSIYDVAATFKPCWMWGHEVALKMKWVCWPQHVTFMLGIISYSLGAVLGMKNK